MFTPNTDRGYIFPVGAVLFVLSTVVAVAMFVFGVSEVKRLASGTVRNPHLWWHILMIFFFVVLNVFVATGTFLSIVIRHQFASRKLWAFQLGPEELATFDSRRRNTFNCVVKDDHDFLRLLISHYLYLQREEDEGATFLMQRKDASGPSEIYLGLGSKVKPL